MDRDSLERLIKRNRPLIRKLCRKHCFCEDDLDDLRSVVVANIVENIDSFDPERGTFGTWLGVIVRNEASKAHTRDSRKKRGGGYIHLSLDDLLHVAAPKISLRCEEDTGLLKSLESLPPKVRKAFELMKIEGLTSFDVAEIMQTTPATVRTLVWQAKQLLRPILEEMMATSS